MGQTQTISKIETSNPNSAQIITVVSEKDETLQETVDCMQFNDKDDEYNELQPLIGERERLIPISDDINSILSLLHKQMSVKTLTIQNNQFMINNKLRKIHTQIYKMESIYHEQRNALLGNQISLTNEVHLKS
ncbi:hypothetical protein RF11_13869 [Thelohanellus kitauei]|uniref:Uncharacterized protein n=1 Tax=Thelohanellus kitauei TaxID=669202 RepID=A0A0C2JDJ6_THEKT|nr:hypothetical protein RF11_13869 [Thelohanellus kitauei]